MREQRNIFKPFREKVYYFETVSLYRKFFYSCSLVGLQDYPRLQFIFFAILNFIFWVMLIYLRPYKNSKKNAIRIMSETAFLSALILLVFFPVLESSLNISQVKTLGWSITFLLVFQLVIELISQTLTDNIKVKPKRLSTFEIKEKKTKEKELQRKWKNRQLQKDDLKK